MLNLKEKSVLLGVLFSILLSLIGFAGKCEKISDKVLRLHIIANSNSFEDQNLKLKVRDKLLKDSQLYFANIHNISEAQKILCEHINDVISIAKDEIKKNGYNYDVTAEIKNTYFNTRVYNTVTLPAGNYNALNILIGEGKGKNWWCVIFPPMCLSSAKEQDELNDVLNPSEMDIVEGGEKYHIKFMVVELLENLKNWIKNLFNYS